MNLPVSISLPYFGGRALKYGYSNARVRGMKGMLLKNSELDELIKVGSIDAMVELLQRTHYKDDLTQLSLLYHGSVLVELAAAKHFSKVAKKVLFFSPKGDRNVVKSILKRWDILNLKTIIGSRRLGKKFEEVLPYIVPVGGGLTLQDLERIYSSDEKNMFEQIRRTDFGREVFTGNKKLLTLDIWDIFKTALKNNDSFLQLQTLLDAYIYAYMETHLSSASKDLSSVKKLFKKEIDAKNIAIIERLKARGTPREKIKSSLIRGGTLNDSSIRALLDSKDFNAVVSVAKNKLSRLGFDSSENIKTLSDLEIALEKAVASEKLRVFYRSVLSIGTVIGFLLLKEEELNNLRKIAKGKEFNIPEDKLRETLVTV